MGSRIKNMAKKRALNVTQYVNDSIEIKKQQAVPRTIETSAQLSRKHVQIGQSLELAGIRTQLLSP